MVFLLLETTMAFAQSKKNQSYQQKGSFSKISKTAYRSNSEVANKLNTAKILFKTEPEKALDLVHDALLIAIKENFIKDEADAYKLLGEFNYKLNEYNLSYKNYGKAIAIYQKQSYPIYAIYYDIGKSAEMLKDYQNASSYFTKYLKLAKSKRDKNAQAKAHIALGNTYLKWKELKGAKHHYTEALNIEKKRNNKQGIVVANLKLGEVEEARNNDKQAIQYYRSSQNTAKQINDDKAVNQAYSNISNIYENQRNVDEGIEINQEALNYNQQRNNQNEIAQSNINLANFYLQDNNEQEAIKSLENSIQIAEQTGDIEKKTQATQVLSKAYNKSGLDRQAEEKYKEYLILEDSLYKMRARQLANQNKKGELLENAQNKLSLLEKDKELSEKTIELLRQEKLISEQFISQQKIITYSLIAGIIILIVTAFLVYRSNKAKNKANQLLVLKSLRAQMNPHFIFNALNSVNSFISKSDERAANRYLADFSRLMRDVMENSQQDFISLAKEIAILEMYLKLEHHRFKDKFEYSFEVDESINAEEFFIPPMLIQPYIENAVWHGLRYKKEKGFLAVSIQQLKNTIIVKVIDDGIGRKKSQELKTENQKAQKSTGIKNIDSRLKIISDIYKAKLDVKINDIEPSGTEVTVIINQEFNDR